MATKGFPFICAHDHLLGVVEHSEFGKRLLIFRHAVNEMPETPDIAVTIGCMGVIDVNCELCAAQGLEAATMFIIQSDFQAVVAAAHDLVE